MASATAARNPPFVAVDAIDCELGKSSGQQPTRNSELSQRKNWAVYYSIIIALGAVVGILGFFVLDRPLANHVDTRLMHKAFVAPAGLHPVSRPPAFAIANSNIKMSTAVASPVDKLREQLNRYPIISVPKAGFDGVEIGQEDVSFKVAKAAQAVVHRKVVAEQANMRLGTAVAKTRAEVRGGGRKPYQQKGTGRARRGSSRSPLIRGGGKSFGPRQKSYHIDMNKKEKKLAISTALMSGMERTTIVPDLESNFNSPKTKDMYAFLERLGCDTSGRYNTLMIIKDRHENTYLSARNIPYLNLINLNNINARDILRAKKIVISEGALAELRGRYGRQDAASNEEEEDADVVVTDAATE